nr:Rv2175c family DNA-binding protein [Demequina sp. TTPB684]
MAPPCIERRRGAEGAHVTHVTNVTVVRLRVRHKRRRSRRYACDVSEWLSVPECAELLGVPLSRVREFLRERNLIAVRRGENNALYLPAGQIVEGEHGHEVLATVRGTIIVLADAGLSDDVIVEWLTTFHEELGESPLDALRSGKRAPVRRLAQTVF